MPVSANALVSTAVGTIAERVLAASEARRPVRIIGAGTWLERSAPIDAAEDINCSALAGIVDYVPGDLTITVGAGTSMAEIETVTAANGQWLTLDPPGHSSGTIGATISTATPGPLATGFGTARDLVLGLEAVSGTGKVIRAGGRVVKNVAGFDLVRLFTGARGTLGVLTEVSLRLRARPERDETLAVRVGDGAPAVRAISAALRSWPFTPMAAELLDARASRVVGLGEAPMLVVRVGGNARGVEAARKRIATLGKAIDAPAGIWQKVRSLDEPMAVVARVSDLPASFADRWFAAHAVLGPDALMAGSLLRGTMRIMTDSMDRARHVALRSALVNARMVYETLPDVSVWSAVTVAPATDSLDERVRVVFDPAGIMNPGALRLAR